MSCFVSVRSIIFKWIYEISYIWTEENDMISHRSTAMINNYSPKWRWIIVLVYTTQAE